MIRAKGLATATGFGGVSDGGFWEGKTRAAIQALLHAAALDGRDSKTVYQWSLSPAAAADAVRILSTSSDAAEGWADSLDAMIQSDPRTRDSISQGVSLSFGSLADPRVLDAVSPSEDERFDPETFLRENGTMYLLATGAGAGASSALRQHWLICYDQQAKGNMGIVWHNDFAAARERLRDWVSIYGSRLDRDRPTRITAWPGGEADEWTPPDTSEQPVTERSADFVAFVLDTVRARGEEQDAAMREIIENE